MMKRRTGLLLGCVVLVAGGLALAASLAGCVDGSFLSFGSNTDGTSGTSGSNGTSEANGEDPDTGDPIPPAETIVLVVEVGVAGQGTVEQKVIDTFIELTATAEEGWEFEEWSGTLRSSVNPVTIRASESTQVTANFVEVELQDPETIRTDTDGDGVTDDADQCSATPAAESVGADGCAPSQLDSDGDQVSDAVDLCPGTPSEEAEAANESGCAPSQLDTDSDSVMDGVDQCPNTPIGAIVLPSGCALSQLDADFDGVFDDSDHCPSSAPGEAVDSTGCRACGNFVINDGETCDPPNSVDCDSNCQNIVLNDACGDSTAVSDGSTIFSNIGTLTDGPQETGSCASFGADVWFCYTASCTDMATASLCDSSYDTIMTVYEGCGCPEPGAIACDDDFCEGEGSGTGSQVSFPVVAGESYLIRVGGWRDFEGNDSTGVGTLAISCGAVIDVCEEGGFYNDGICDTFCPLVDPDCASIFDWCEEAGMYSDGACDAFCPLPDPDCEGGGDWCEEAGHYDDGLCDWDCPLPDPDCQGGADCGPGAGDCFAPNGTPACDDADCCAMVCALDPYCCTDEWDESCAMDAGYRCGGGNTDSCGPGAGDCFAPNGTPGCEDVTCCDSVCQLIMPSCCTVGWTTDCAEAAMYMCGGGNTDSCGPGAGSCFSPSGNGTPGCGDIPCCETVCTFAPYCCSVEWDFACADTANILCGSAQEGCGPGAGDCHEPNGTPGCDDESCCSLICTELPECCVVEWDQFCAMLADEVEAVSGGMFCGQ